MRRYVLVLLFAAVLPTPAGGEVKVGTRADGLTLIYNEAPEHHARRVAAALLPVPDAAWHELIERQARQQRLEPRLIRAVIQVESGYNPRALSHRGAMGLMQLMPGTARALAVSDPYDPEENLRGGTAYLRQMLDRFRQRVEWALAAYNAGPGAVERYRGIPPYRETQHYVDRVLGLYRGTTLSPGAQGRMPFVLRRNGRLLITTDPPGAP